MPTSTTNKPLIAITMGDAAGIGPEVTLKALQRILPLKKAIYLIVGNYNILKQNLRLLNLKLRLKKINRIEDFSYEPDLIPVLNIGKLNALEFGRYRKDYAQVTFECLEKSCALIKMKKADAIVTAPLNKESLNRAGYVFRGHTEYLASAFGIKDYAMMLIAGKLRLTLASRHLPIKRVSLYLSQAIIHKAIALTYQGLKRYFKIYSPLVGICALNPHGGEKGVIGDEEDKLILPAIQSCEYRENLKGPFPVDTLFQKSERLKYDAIVCMHHDQALTPLKILFPQQGVNFTLGLPFIRTSPLHGTAYDIAGKRCASARSMEEALDLATKLTKVGLNR